MRRHPAARLAQRTAYEAATLVARWPRLALPLARLRGHGVIVTEATKLVVEGFPCSGNSFAVAALGVAQRGPLDIAHHTHTPANVLAAVARNLPTLVLAREPAAAATDFVRIRPALRFDQAVRGYVRFYEPLLAVIGEVVVARTDQVHADLGEVVGRLNRRFGTAFVPFEHTQANLARVERAASEYFAGRSGPGLPLVGRASSGPVPTTPAPTAVDGVHARYGVSSALSRAERLFAALRRESERP